MSKFQVGDRVEVYNSGTRYNYTTDGSYGIVTSSGNGSTTVKFQYYSSGAKITGNITIQTIHLKLKPYTKLEKMLA